MSHATHEAARAVAAFRKYLWRSRRCAMTFARADRMQRVARVVFVGTVRQDEAVETTFSTFSEGEERCLRHRQV